WRDTTKNPCLEVLIRDEGDYSPVLRFADFLCAIPNDSDIFDSVRHSTTHDEMISMSIRKGGTITIEKSMHSTSQQGWKEEKKGEREEYNERSNLKRQTKIIRKEQLNFLIFLTLVALGIYIPAVF
ncbi:hypothetical protein E2I00_002862, partial [Balaenoptera physalus]